MRKIVLITVLIISFVTVMAQKENSKFRVLKVIPVAGEGGWDYLIVDPASQQLFISHGTCVEVLDLKTEKVIRQIPNTPGVHGIALVPELNKGFISAGRIDSVVVFDLTTLITTAKIKTGKRPDAIVYDPFSKRVFTFNAGDQTITAIDAATNTVAGSIAVSGKPEYAVSDGKGVMFCNIEDKSTVVKFDPVNLKVLNEWPLKPGEEPSGLAYDPSTNRLFSACSESKQIVVMDATDGKVISLQPMGEGCDGIVFIPSLKVAVSSNGEGTLTVVGQDGPAGYKVEQTVATRKSARTITCDKKAGLIYLPFAEVNMENGKRKITPGSFGICVVGK